MYTYMIFINKHIDSCIHTCEFEFYLVIIFYYLFILPFYSTSFLFYRHDEGEFNHKS